MQLEEAIKYFGTALKMCKELGIERQNYTFWRRKNRIPLVQQARIEQLTNGLLKADPWRK
jgi:hypothetical protein